jgi:hypothetical protein
MEEKTIEKIKWNSTVAFLFIVVGLTAMIGFSEFVLGVILVGIGAIRVLDETTRSYLINLLSPFVSSLTDNFADKGNQKIEGSPHARQQRAKGDIVYGETVANIRDVHGSVYLSQNQKREGYERSD